MRAACAEFPNDNPALHAGAIWFCAALAASPECELPEAEPIVAEVATDPTPPVVEAEDETDGIEIVDELEIADAVEESMAPPPLADTPPPVPHLASEEAPGAELDDPFVTFVAVLEDVAKGAGADDAALRVLRVLLGRERIDPGATAEALKTRAQSLAWQAILRGESEDFDACGAAMLDEWSAAVVAGVVGNPARADLLKRELRRRGVAAFGLVERAA
jgi:hypothetical protein